MIWKEPRGDIVDPKVAIVNLPLFWTTSSLYEGLVFFFLPQQKKWGWF
jgi:hypothetical protein